jgi:predicted SprT family Zn-dependent metalloprotease
MSATLFAARKQEIIAKVNACIETGNKLFNTTLPTLDIRFDLKGRAAGMAGRRGNHYYLRFNTDMMLRDAWDHLINNTVPHEVAHSFCQFNPKLGSDHNSGWQRVCVALGGKPDRCHAEAVVYGKGTTYEYVTDRGHKVRMGDKYHKHVQSGMPLSYKKGLGTVTKQCTYSIVGVQGRTLATPVVKVPVATAPVTPVPRVINPAVTAARTSYTIGVAAPAPRTPAPAFAAGASKASIARAIMLAGHTRNMPYEQVITAIMAATGHDRQLARATYKANQSKVGIPVQ